jgi:hypothetical protein
MCNGSHQELAWYLGSVSGSTPTAGNWTVNKTERISDVEHDSHGTSASLLNEVFSQSSFAALQKRYGEFKDAIEAVADGLENRRLTPDMITSIGTSIDDALTSLRRFADRTGHALSQRYGKDSQEYRTLKEGLSYEFDNAFSYRFAWHLRNYSDHVGSAPFRVSQEADLSTNGGVEQSLQILIDARTLLEGYAWHSQVRSDLERINGEFSIEAVMDGLQESCNRAYCKTVLAQESSIAAAATCIRELTRRANPPNGFGAAFIQAPANGELWPMTVSPVSIELAELAEAVIQQARTMARDDL